jgi:hypothetical protein
MFLVVSLFLRLLVCFFLRVRKAMYDLTWTTSVSPTRRRVENLVANKGDVSPTSAILDVTPMYQRRSMKMPTRICSDPTSSLLAFSRTRSPSRTCGPSSLPAIPGPRPFVETNNTEEDVSLEPIFMGSLRETARDIEAPVFDTSPTFFPQRHRLVKKRKDDRVRRRAGASITTDGVEKLLRRVRDRDERIDELMERMCALDEKTNQRRRTSQQRRRASTSSLSTTTSSTSTPP